MTDAARDAYARRLQAIETARARLLNAAVDRVRTGLSGAPLPLAAVVLGGASAYVAAADVDRALALARATLEQDPEIAQAATVIALLDEEIGAVH